MKFKNPQNDYVETASVPLLWALLFGPLYFVFKGAHRHFVIFALLAISLSMVIHPVLVIFVWFVYAFLAPSIVESSYLRRGWVGIKPDRSINAHTGMFFNINSETIFFIAAAALVVWILATVFA